jgi:hypothetical protein
VLVGFSSTHGGCFHYRAELPARVLPLYAHAFPGGVSVVCGGDLALNAPEHRCPIGLVDDIDEVIPEVIVLAGQWPAIVGYAGIDAARASGQIVVCDIDDYPNLPPDHPYHVRGARARKLAALRAADAVTCSTPALRDHLAEVEIGATVVRNGIDATRYELERFENLGRLAMSCARAERDHLDELVIGYRGLLCGFHDDDVRELAQVFEGLSDVRFVHVGADPREEFSFADLAGVAPELVEERHATEFDAYGPALAGVDLALIPLADRDVNRCKSNIAALEWHAAGVPWLATRHPEFELATSGPGLISNRLQWRRRVDELRDPARRCELYDAQAVPVEAGGQGWANAVLAALRARS